jgi:hypothetical protein
MAGGESAGPGEKRMPEEPSPLPAATAGHAGSVVSTSPGAPSASALMMPTLEVPEASSHPSHGGVMAFTQTVPRKVLALAANGMSPFTLILTTRGSPVNEADVGYVPPGGSVQPPAAFEKPMYSKSCDGTVGVLHGGSFSPQLVVTSTCDPATILPVVGRLPKPVGPLHLFCTLTMIGIATMPLVMKTALAQSELPTEPDPSAPAGHAPPMHHSVETPAEPEHEPLSTSGGAPSRATGAGCDVLVKV